MVHGQCVADDGAVRLQVTVTYMGKPTVEQRWRTATEQLIGRLTTLNKTNPERAIVLIEQLLRVSGFTGDAEVRKTYMVSLKIDFDDEKRHGIMLKLARQAGRLLLTQASLIADNRPPQVAIECDDFFEGGTRETLSDLPEGTENPGDGIVDEQPE
jgi:hypothetical protein